MRRRFPWSLLLGLGAGVVLLGRLGRSRRSGAAARSRGGRKEGAGRTLAREPEVVRGPEPAGTGLERPVASAAPDTVAGRSTRAVPPPGRPAAPGGEFQPVVPDAPEVRDPAAEPPALDPDAGRGERVPPTVRRRS